MIKNDSKIIIKKEIEKSNKTQIKNTIKKNTASSKTPDTTTYRRPHIPEIISQGGPRG